MPAVSDTAPASISSWGVVRPATVARSELDRVMVRELVPFVVMVPLDKVTPPVFEPDSRMWSLVATCFAESNGSLNVMANWPDPVVYAAEEKVGFVVSFMTVTGTALLLPKRELPLAPMRI